MKIYTKTGDSGETSLFGGRRLPKNHLRIESYGTVDELNSHVGFVRDHITDKTQRHWLKEIQDRLFTIGANLASDPERELPKPDLRASDLELLETAIDSMNEQLPQLRHFILPGGHPVVSACHLARCVCRRAERRVVSLHQSETVEDIIIRYLNRLSDFLFVLSRKIGHDLSVEEVIWKSRTSAD